MSGAPTAAPYPAASRLAVPVKEMTPGEEARWDAFVASCPEATFFHRAGWKEVIEKAFGHKIHFLMAEAGGSIRGVLPLAHLRSRLFGSSLVSMPFCVYGGAAANDDPTRRALEDAAEALALQLGVDYLELRNRTLRRPEWPRKDLYEVFRKEMDPDPEQNLLRIPRKQRAMVRKGIEAGLQADADDGVERLFHAYAESVHNLGTPVFPRRYFEILKDVFDEDCEVLTVTKDGRTVSSVMSFYFRDEVLPYYGGGTRNARDLKANDFMYWELMRRSCERGLRVFDFGRSKKGTGSYRFKKHWGFEPQPLHYQYRLVKSREVPDINPLNPKFRLYVQLWKRLPLTLTKTLGPLISRNLG